MGQFLLTLETYTWMFHDRGSINRGKIARGKEENKMILNYKLPFRFSSSFEQSSIVLLYDFYPRISEHSFPKLPKTFNPNSFKTLELNIMYMEICHQHISLSLWGIVLPYFRNRTRQVFSVLHRPASVNAAPRLSSSFLRFLLKKRIKMQFSTHEAPIFIPRFFNLVHKLFCFCARQKSNVRENWTTKKKKRKTSEQPRRVVSDIKFHRGSKTSEMGHLYSPILPENERRKSQSLSFEKKKKTFYVLETSEKISRALILKKYKFLIFLERSIWIDFVKTRKIINLHRVN